MTQTKQCRMCKTPIASDAKKCPQCKSFQPWYLRPVTIVVPLIVLYGLFFFILIFEDIMDDEISFPRDVNPLQVTESKLTFGETEKCGGVVNIIGRIKNNSDVNWESLHIQVECYNKSGELVDTDQDKKYSFLIPSQMELPFKISFPRSLPEDHYADHAVTVIYAEDADPW